jgi:hypothetical protein
MHNNVATLPENVIALLQKKKSHQTITPNTTGELSFESVREGSRNAALMAHLGRLRHHGASEPELLAAGFKFNQEECEPPLDPSEVQQVAQNVAKYAVGMQSVEEAVEELNRKHAIVTIGGRVSILWIRESTFELITNIDLRLLYANRMCAGPGGKAKCIADAWLTHPNRGEYTGVVFEPGETKTKGAWNLWSKWGVTPIPGDCFLFIEHIRDIICAGNTEHAQWVMAWLADMFQRPQQKPGTALVFRGNQGTGKTIVGKIIGKLLGRSYTSVASARFLTGNFNSHLANCLFLQIDEGFWAGDRTAEGILKDMVTSPTMWIERKRMDPIEFPNYLRVLVTSNSEWVVPAGPKDRRFCVLDVSDQQMQQSSYFESLMEQMEHGGYEALLHHLLTLEYSNVDLRKIPRTAAWFDQLVSSLRPDEGWWYDILTRGTIPGDENGYGITLRGFLYDQYLRSSNKRGVSRKSLETQVGRFLTKYVPGLQKEEHKSGTEVRGRYRFPPLAECRKEFARILGYEIPWESPTEWQKDSSDVVHRVIELEAKGFDG